MKFTIASVILALAVAANASLYPLGLGGYPYLGGYPGPVLSHGPGLWGAPYAGLPAAVQVAPLGVHLGGLGPVPSAVHVAPVAHAHQGVYVAQTRGAVHTAPLAGHLASASSINVAPAPGTI